MWRQGDIFIEAVKDVPDHARPNKLPHLTLVHGEVTGHSHRVEDPSAAMLFAGRDGLYLSVEAPQARIVHEEHGPIDLPRGVYRVWRQREYTPQAIRIVQD